MECKDCKYFEWEEEDEKKRKCAEKAFEVLFETIKKGNKNIDEEVCTNDDFYRFTRGYCRRFPPEREGIVGVYFGDWCGEYKRK